MNCGRCCLDFEIKLVHLLFPDQMSDIGQEFVEAHGITRVRLNALRVGALLLPDGETVKIRHRCQQLTDDNRCGIYETRPQICRSFDCGTRTGTDACTMTPPGTIYLLRPTMPPNRVMKEGHEG